MSTTTLSDITDIAAFLAAPRSRELCDQSSIVSLAGDQPPWQPTGIRLNAGDAYVLFASGRIDWSKRYTHLHGGPRFHCWARINPGGVAVNLSSSSGTFVADTSGELELGIYMGLWADKYGELATSTKLYEPLSGGLEIAVARLRGDPGTVLASLAAASGAPPTLRTELQRFKDTAPPPAGWQYLHECGYSTIYTQGEDDGQTVIEAVADDDQGILRFACDFPLDQSTRVNWQWRVDEHPSREPENLAMSHDYISLAAEFDNGRDLTWIWSSSLARGTYFDCPVKAWRERETHYVVRTGDDEHGRWYGELRGVFDDVSESMGPPPTRITAVWLIVLSSFHHRTAQASFKQIELRNDLQTLSIL